MSSRARKAVVTGGAGFIGSHLAERLLTEADQVTVVDNFSTGRPQNLAHLKGEKRLELIEADINDGAALKRAFAKADWVFHMAALADIVPSIQRPMDYFRANVDGSASVLEAARAAGVKRFLYTASSSCYGLADQTPTPETAPIRPQYPYALTKSLGEQLTMHWAQVYKLPSVSLRLFNVYGPRSRTSGTYGAVFGVFLAQKLAGKPYTVVGDGRQTRDFTYVSDVVSAFLTAAQSTASGEIFNVGTSAPVSVNRLVELLGGDKIYIPKRPGEPDCTHADTAKIRRVLGWKPRVSFEEGVKRMLEHIDYWKDAPVWEPKSIEKATKEWFNLLGASGR